MKLWKKDSQRRPLPQVLLTPVALVWLSITLALAVLPHANQLPGWLAPGFVVLAVWRGFIAVRGLLPPPRGLLLVVVAVAVIGVLLAYKTLFGRDAGVALLMAMAACKLLEARNLRDGMVLVFLGYLLIMSNLLFSQDIPVVLYLLLVVMLMLATQVIVHRQHAGLAVLMPLQLSGKMVLSAIPVMLVLFVLFPRIPGPLWGLPKDAYKGRTGLSEEMAPGTISQLSQSDEVAFRVRFEGEIPPPGQRYWRGPVLWKFDGRRWQQYAEIIRKKPIPLSRCGSPIKYSVILEPSNQRWLFALDLPASVPPNAFMTTSFQLVNRKPVNEVYRYTVQSCLRYQTGSLTGMEYYRGLQLPENSNPRARELAEEWRQRDARPEAIVKAALALFRKQPFYYTLNPPLLGFNSVDDFIFHTRKGFCEHYASAFVFLMRAAGIPSRVVTGYQGGQYNDLGDYIIVRQSEAHAWAEVWLAGRGWVRIDPTAAVAPSRVESGLFAALPDGESLSFLSRRGGDYEWLRQLVLRWDTLNIIWNEWVLAYGPDRQKDVLSDLGLGQVDWEEMTIAMLVALAILALCFAGIRWWGRFSHDPVVGAWQRFCARLARKGLARGAHEGPLDFAERVISARPDLEKPVREICQLYIMLRYGSFSSPAAVRRLQRLVWRFRV